MSVANYLRRATHPFRLRGPLEADPTAQVLNALLWVLIAWMGAWGVILLPFHFADRFWSMPATLVVLIGLACALVLLRRGRFRAASFAYLAGIWFYATLIMPLNGGSRSTLQLYYVTLPISAAWLLGYEAAVWVSVTCISCMLIFAVLELGGVMPPRKIPGTPLGLWVTFAMACLIGALPAAQILRELRLALAKSRQAEDALQAEIDEHERTERALSESEQRFRIAADTAPVMILARDASQNATFFNKVWLDFTGRSLEEELGRGWTESVHPDDLESHRTALAAAYTERMEYRLQFRLKRADGEYRLLLSHGVPRFELDRTFDGYIASCIDITDFKRAQEEALAVQKWESLGVLAGGIAHDFNNLLGGISAQSELLMEELQNSPASEIVSMIQSVAARAAEIVRQLMVYAGQESTTLDQVDLASLVRDMLPLMNVSTSKNATFEVHLPNGLPMIRANVAQIRQVILNLITNASEALQGKVGIVTISLTEIGSQDFIEHPTLKPLASRRLRLTVSDTGCGMSEQVRAGIFDPFFSTKGPGRGLGLSAVQGIVRSHGGEISVVSSPGRGSRFEILLPCPTYVEELPSDTGLKLSASGPEVFTGTVLIVEDEEALRSAVAKCLAGRGVRVLEASDGWAAVEVFQTHASEIDIVVLDATMPGLSGNQLLQKMLEIRSPLKVIITSAYGRERALATVNEGPPYPYIRKPYRVDELFNLIRQTCLSGPGAQAAQQAAAK